MVNSIFPSGYIDFNYNFGFDESKPDDGTDDNSTFTTPMNFNHWINLTSPITTESDDQLSTFLLQTNNEINTPFSFNSFNYAGIYC